MTQEEVAKAIGKSRPAIANSLRLLALPQQVVDLIREGKLSAGHGRALLALEEESAILEAAQTAVKKHWTVREIEKMAQSSIRRQKSLPGRTKIIITLNWSWLCPGPGPPGDDHFEGQKPDAVDRVF